MITHFYWNYFGKSAFKTDFIIEKKIDYIFLLQLLRKICI